MGEAERIPLLIANAVESFEKARISNDANEISTKLQETADLLRDARNNVLVLCDDIKGKTPLTDADFIRKYYFPKSLITVTLQEIKDNNNNK